MLNDLDWIPINKNNKPDSKGHYLVTIGEKSDKTSKHFAGIAEYCENEWIVNKAYEIIAYIPNKIPKPYY